MAGSPLLRHSENNDLRRWNASLIGNTLLPQGASGLPVLHTHQRRRLPTNIGQYPAPKHGHDLDLILRSQTQSLTRYRSSIKLDHTHISRCAIIPRASRLSNQTRIHPVIQLDSSPDDSEHIALPISGIPLRNLLGPSALDPSAVTGDSLPGCQLVPSADHPSARRPLRTAGSDSHVNASAIRRT